MIITIVFVCLATTVIKSCRRAGHLQLVDNWAIVSPAKATSNYIVVSRSPPACFPVTRRSIKCDKLYVTTFNSTTPALQINVAYYRT